MAPATTRGTMPCRGQFNRSTAAPRATRQGWRTRGHHPFVHHAAGHHPTGHHPFVHRAHRSSPERQRLASPPPAAQRQPEHTSALQTRVARHALDLCRCRKAVETAPWARHRAAANAACGRHQARRCPVERSLSPNAGRENTVAVPACVRLDAACVLSGGQRWGRVHDG